MQIKPRNKRRLKQRKPQSMVIPIQELLPIEIVKGLRLIGANKCKNRA
ncbi:hypothetical protein KM915_10340 [Cytobacillus oceanisediminis]|nr:hypothetical protein [Cytobacillus oceanisediminis]MBU8730452.1 hypothetical protein [Cytobacillus oceanisediminis]